MLNMRALRKKIDFNRRLNLKIFIVCFRVLQDLNRSGWDPKRLKIQMI